MFINTSLSILDRTHTVLDIMDIAGNIEFRGKDTLQKMKVLMANTFHYYRGGDCAYTFQATKLLQQMGHRVVHFAMRHPLNLSSRYSEFFVDEIDLLKELEKNRLQSGVRVLARAIYSNKSKQKLSQLLNRYPVDIAHIQNIHGHITPSILHTLRARSIPIIWTLHDYFPICPNSTLFSRDKVCEACKGGRFYNVAIKKCRKESLAASLVVMLEEYVDRLLGLMKLVDSFIAPSDFLRNKMIEYGFPVHKVIHIPNFVDTKNIKPSLNHDGYILYSGRLSYEKGLQTLIKGILLRDSAKLLISGDGPLRRQLETVVDRTAKGKVKFLGHIGREKLRELIDGALFVVLPSEWYENFPYSILEAFASAKPVVGSRIGGIPQLIRAGETGLLFEPGDAHDLAEKIQWMVERPKEREEMGRRARELVEKEYNPELHYKRLMGVYRAALKKHCESDR